LPRSAALSPRSSSQITSPPAGTTFEVDGSATPSTSATSVPAAEPSPEQVVFPSQTVKSTVPVGTADKVRALNRYMEQKAWGAFRYQVFPSYDFAPIAVTLKTEHATP